ncbi:hypothetical protein FKW77_003151 [Venturia effusa]|uniref:DUF7702 domain-containing protein n=1 Tax=Venturia effusa TaxID=50376 RepID=A0A517LC45_9PEZI|nr:hypothetical protein FKW77_003151 [Venturia effusa]
MSTLAIASKSGLLAIKQLAAAEVAIFSSLLIMTIYIAIKHGAKGVMVWHMLAGLESMAIIAAALRIAQNGNPRKYGGGVAFAVSGLQAMLCLVPIGLIYEVCLFIPTIGLWTNRLNLALFHVLPLMSIIIAQIFGAPKSHEARGDHSPVNATLAKLGFLVLLLDLVMLMVEGTYLLVFRVREATSYKITRQLKTLLYTMIAALPFGMIRLGHEVAYIFNPSQDRNLEIGAFGNMFFISFLMPIAFTIPLVIGGFLTRNIGSAHVGLVREDSRRAFGDEIELKAPLEEIEEQQHNRRTAGVWMR